LYLCGIGGWALLGPLTTMMLKGLTAFFQRATLIALYYFRMANIRLLIICSLGSICKELLYSNNISIKFEFL